MKTPPFEYDAPDSIAATLDLLAQHADDAKVLAGGQSLVPLLNFRLARPARLVDINGIAELDYIRREDGRLHIGALTRQAALERSTIVARHWPLLKEALRWVAHPQIRNRGTAGGSVAHADPAAELPAALAALDGAVRVRSVRGARTIPWRELFVTHLTTSIEPDELLVEIELPAVPERTGAAFSEYSRRHGDFALGGAAVTVTLDGSGGCSGATIALLGAAPKPVRATEAEELLKGRAVDDDAAEAAGAAAVRDVTPTGDIHGGSEYRRRLIAAMVRRAIMTAAGQAPREG